MIIVLNHASLKKTIQVLFCYLEPLTGTNVASGISTDKIYQELLQIFRSNYDKISSTRSLTSL